MRSWKDVRAEAGLDEERVTAARAELEAQVRAYRLAEVRKRQHRTQTELAEQMGVSQARVSGIERGGLQKVELATLRAYVEALGGHLELVANFGDERLVLSDDLPRSA